MVLKDQEKLLCEGAGLMKLAYELKQPAAPAFLGETERKCGTIRSF